MSDKQHKQGRNHHEQADLVLGVRGAKLARDVGAVTVGELARFTAEELLEAKCFGETSLREIREGLAQRGLSLGMTPAQLSAHPGLQARVVSQKEAGATPSASEDEREGACCGHCEETSRNLRERTEAERSYLMSLAELELSVRATNLLESEGIATVRDLVIRSGEELLEVRGFTPELLREVTKRLAERGLQLGLKLAAK